MSKKINWIGILEWRDNNASKKKALILEKAFQILLKNGIEALTLTRISKESGISKSLIVYHYSETRLILIDLFIGISKGGIQNTVKKMKGKKTLEEELIAIVEGAITWAPTSSQLGRLFLIMYQLSSNDPEIRDIHKRMLEIGQERIRICILESMTFSNLKEIEQLSFNIHNQIIGTIIRLISLNDISEIKRYKEDLIAAIKKLITVQN